MPLKLVPFWYPCKLGGRVNRPDDAHMKKYGYMLDMFVLQEGQTASQITVEKILDYYDQIINLADNMDIISEREKIKSYRKYIGLLKKTMYDKEKDEISIRVDENKKIKIRIELIGKKMDWSVIKDMVQINIKKKCQINDYVELKENFKLISKIVDVNELNPLDWAKWYRTLSKHDNRLIHYDKIKSNQKYWINHNWFYALDIDKNFYQNIEELAKHLPKNIETYDQYLKAARKDNKLPLDVMEYYGYLPDKLFEKIRQISPAKIKQNNEFQFV